MTIDKITEHIYAFRFPGEGDNVLDQLFDQWNDTEYLHDFFTKNLEDLKYYKVYSVTEAVDDTIEDAEVLEDIFFDAGPVNFETVFSPLHNQEHQELSLSQKKAKRKNSKNKHDCWLRIYALKVDKNLYVITGGAIKITRAMQQKPHTTKELQKIERCRNFLKSKGVFDADSFADHINQKP